MYIYMLLPVEWAKTGMHHHQTAAQSSVKRVRDDLAKVNFLFHLGVLFENLRATTNQLGVKHSVVELLLVFLLILHRSVEPLSFVDDLGIVRLKFDGTIEVKTGLIELLKRPMGNARSIECLDVSWI